MTNWIRMAIAYPLPLPGYEPKHQPSFYLSDEARELRLAALVERLARDPGHPDYASVPPRIQRLVDARRESQPAQEAAA